MNWNRYVTERHYAEKIKDNHIKQSATYCDNNLGKKKKQKSTLKYLILKLSYKVGILIFALWIFLGVVFGIAHVDGESMYPRLRDGDYIFFQRIGYEPDVGDVIVYTYDYQRRYSRVVAKAGDVIDLSSNGQLLVNDNLQEEEVFYPTNALEDGIELPYQVPDDSVFVLCDFRIECTDSRSFGAISESDIEGGVIAVLRFRGI